MGKNKNFNKMDEVNETEIAVAEPTIDEVAPVVEEPAKEEPKKEEPKKEEVKIEKVETKPVKSEPAPKAAKKRTATL